MKTKIILAAAFLMLLSASSFAQRVKIDIDLTDEQMRTIEAAAIGQVNTFNDYVSLIWKRPTKEDQQDMAAFRDLKNSYVEQALLLFIAKGEDLWAYDSIQVRLDDGSYEYQLDSIFVREAAIMETTSLKNPSKKNRQTVKTYLNRAAGLLGNPTNTYTEVEVTSSEAYFSRKLRKTGEGRYEGTLTFSQWFRGYRDGKRIIYGDLTDKTIKVYVERQVVLGQEIWKIQLGDVEAGVPTRIK